MRDLLLCAKHLFFAARVVVFTMPDFAMLGALSLAPRYSFPAISRPTPLRVK